MKYKGLSAVFASLALLAGCASQPLPQLALSPAAVTVTDSHQGSLHLTSQDLRNANYIASINKSDEAAQLIGPTEPPRQLLQRLLSDAFSKQGYQMSASAPVSMQLNLVTLESQVEQGAFKYQNDSQVVVNLKVDNGKQILNKTYKGNAQRKAPLTANAADIELELNSLINSVLQDIANDDELHQFIAQ
ncbi:YajG family lipoprotein [Paraferrimonas sedimenticola]|uniref:Lipoprotein n=1 Tax=Paraferrimonas sedimenticola TaxID=375674 RepID=A0AA37RVX0_9GAMM|nr:YajG family lipoprotein [Paraferrimonas sedimenticola]GLP96800.1 hypothetical protein GCM10007895_21060 [Paraferrimonas sedimenticola]